MPSTNGTAPAHDGLPTGEGDSNRSPRRAAWQAEHVTPEARAVLDADARHFLRQSLSTPCLDVVTRADGAVLETMSGRQLLDFHGNWVHQVGFGHPRVVEAVVEQVRALPFSTRRFTNAVAVELARRLAEAAPGDLDRVLFAPGGAEAVSMALQLARVATGRHKTVSMWDAFHGATLDTVSVGGEAQFRRGIGPLMAGTEHVPPPQPRGCPFRCGDACSLDCARYVEYVLEKEGDVAAVVAETVRSVPYVPPPDYWRTVRRACDRHGALLILDEIPTALGRTGALFAVEPYGIVPDMLVIGKGLGGGVMPIAAVLARSGLDVAPDRALGHYTHEKSPVAAAAALAVLDVIRDEGLVERSRRLGARALERLREIEAASPRVGAVRGIGLLLGVEVVGADGAPDRDVADAVMYEALSRGLSFKVSQGHVLTLVPPLTISEADLDRALDVLADSLDAAARA